MRLVVTGATGFIGTHVMEQARKVFPGDVVGLARTAPPFLRGSHFVSVDLLDHASVDAIFPELKATHLLHLAWDVTPGSYWGALNNIEWLEASIHLMRTFAKAGGQRMVGVGTCAEYDWGDEVLDEALTALRPESLYGVAKNSFCEILSAAGTPLEISTAWARLFWMYGPGENGGRLISDLAGGILAGEVVTTSSGYQKRDFMHVADTASALMQLVLSAYEGAVNIGSGEAIEVRHVAKLFAEKMGRPDLLQVGAGNADNGAPRVVADVKRLTALGFRPTWTLDTGLADTANWWRRRDKEMRAR